MPHSKAFNLAVSHNTCELREAEGGGGWGDEFEKYNATEIVVNET